jgi:beta-glucosidase
VTFRLRKEDLAFWGNERGWITEPGSFRLMIGASSKDIRLQTHWTLR